MSTDALYQMIKLTHIARLLKFRRLNIIALIFVFLMISMDAKNVNGSYVSNGANGPLQPESSGALEFVAKVKPWYRHRKDGKAGREVMLYFNNGKLEGRATVTVQCKDQKEVTEIAPASPLDSLSVLLPEGVGLTLTEATIGLKAKQNSFSSTITVPAKKQWTVFIYPHSHLDIGYTALPSDVAKLQARNIDVGIDLARKTQHYPEGARFVWNTEATWAVMNYLRSATPAQKKQFAEAVKKGWLQIDGGYANLNTSACSDEELLRFFGNVKGIEQLTGQPITTMVEMDNPGAAWGLVSAAAQYGMRGMISFPNNYDVRKYWEHRPFYWVGPDGKTKMLFLQGFPYGIGYTIKGHKYGLKKLQTFSNDYDRVSTSTPTADFLDPFIFEETAKMEGPGNPYDLFAMTWSMADNCVIDADLPEAVKAWNKTYAYPKLVISGAKEILDAYEKKYSAIIPQYKGDFTEFWTNGLGSDAVSVGKGRVAGENLVQAEMLWSMLQPGQLPTEQFKQAWEDLLLSVEHTWGAQNSRSLLAEQIEKNKASYFSNAEQLSEELIHEAAISYRDTTASGFSIINTLSWERGGVVTLTPAQSRAGDKVIDDHGTAVPSQRLSTGELIFEARDIPALGSRFYKVVPGKADVRSKLVASTSELKNDLLSLRINPNSGNISGLTDMANGYQYVDSMLGLNAYQYVTGVYNGKDRPGKPTTTSNVSIHVKEKGPLLVSLAVQSSGDGVKSLDREIRLYAHSPSVEMINTMDKIATTTKEGVHFGFGFRIPDPVDRMEMPWSIVVPNKDQLPRANKNWFVFERWVDISNDQRGITWSAIESPLIEWGSLSGDVLDGARQPWLWKPQVAPTATLYSWPLNNHWDTNFPLEQGGVIRQTYIFRPHGKYDVVEATRFGLEAHRPLIVVQAKKNIIEKPLLNISNPKIVISTIKRTGDKKTLLLRVKSVSDQPEQWQLTWPGAKPKKIVPCTADGTPEKAKNSWRIEPYGMTSMLLVF